MPTKISFLLIALMLIQVSSQLMAQNTTDSKGLKQGEWRKLDAKGKVIYEGRFKDNIPQGLFRYYYEDGNIRSELTYSENGKIAAAVNFHPNRQKMAEGRYVVTKKDGQWKYYNERGTISAEEFYHEGSPTGIWKTYYDDGKLLEECPYVNGLKQGLCKQYFTDGSIKSELNFNKDMYEGSAKHYYPNGKPMLFGQLHFDLKEGVWTAYKENGEKESEIEYRAGEIVHEKYYDKAREEELHNDVKEIPVK